MRRRALIAASGVGVLPIAILVRSGCACSSSTTGPTGVAEGGDGSVIHRLDAGVEGDAPTGIPAGWVPYNDYDPACGFYVPSSVAALPSPIQWQTCDVAAQPSGSSCQQMQVTWPSRPNDNAVGPLVASAAQLNPDGTYTMAIARPMPGMTMYVVADTDGPVHSAFLATNESLCRPYPDDLRDGRIVYQVFEAGETGQLSAYGGGALVANIDDLQPHAQLRFHDQIPRGYLVGLPGVLEVQSIPSDFIVHDWTTLSQTIFTWSAGQDQGLQLVPQAFQGSALHWEATADPITKEKIWTADAGAVDWISFGSDTTQGAGDLGTDGKDMVWLHGSGRSQPSGPYATASFMTAPYATDPTAIQPRRLRSEAPAGLGASLTQVGCGYAARFSAAGIRVLRISDGTSWILAGAQPGGAWGWQSPLAVTCTHVYATVREMADGGTWSSTIARVRLDSLGAGIPHD